MIVHVLPINDVWLHEETTQCDCLPRVKPSSGDLLIIHNAYDCRESFELQQKGEDSE